MTPENDDRKVGQSMKAIPERKRHMCNVPSPREVVMLQPMTQELIVGK